MSTTPEQPQGAPAPDDLDSAELTGVYGFFRRHQTKLIWTAGLFVLLTFSISGPMMSWVRDLFGAEPDRPRITVNGVQHTLTAEDQYYGQLLARNWMTAVPPGVMPPIMRRDRNDNYLSEDYAILRRAAIEEGIGTSYTQVDRSLDALREEFKLDSVAKLAQGRGFQSVAEYRKFVAEAMRVGLYIRLQMLAIDSSDAAAMQRLMREREKITFEGAVFDEKARIEELEAGSELTKEDLTKWLDEQDERKKQRLLVYDLPLAKLNMLALNFDEGQFDPSQWDVLKEFSVTEEQLQTTYDAVRDVLYKDENDEYKPFDEEAVQAQLTRIVQAERVMNDLLGKAREQMTDLIRPINEEHGTLRTAVRDASMALSAADQKREKADKDLDAARQELEAKPDDADLIAKVEKLEGERNTAVEEAETARELKTTKDTELEAAGERLKQAREGFDALAAIGKLIEGKSGFVTKQMSEMKNADDLKDLDELGLDLGKWTNSHLGTAFRSVGDFCAAPSRTSKAIIVFQAVELDGTPLKKWEDLEPLLTEAYWSEKATDEGREKTKKLEAAILRLAKEHMGDFVTSLEDERQSRIDEKVTEWEDGVKAEIEKAKGMLENPQLGNKARTAWQTRLNAKEQELSTKTGRVDAFTATVKKEIDDEIKEESKRHYLKVLKTAAEEAGFEYREFGPLPRDANRLPRFNERYDSATVHLWTSQSELDLDEATATMWDTASRTHIVAVCTKVEPVTVADISRREFESARNNPRATFAQIQDREARNHVFSHEALEARYELVRPKGSQEEVSSTPPK